MEITRGMQMNEALKDKEISACHNDSSEAKFRKSDVFCAVELLKQKIEDLEITLGLSNDKEANGKIRIVQKIKDFVDEVFQKWFLTLFW